ncbi:MAG TPA: methylated-DNA--[protein]-cysteine S-methyltransferase [Desulfotignum sp.]|jgi:methylated-DNA-[protein]-cysteine S-methyltransferase|nr:methylated-DNA--[protein]-cysteine S-methyltransferase [Desulfotignum sp.]
MRFCTYDSPVGQLLVGGEEKLQFISFPRGKQVISPGPDWTDDHRPFSRVLSQLDNYFNRTLTRFSLDFALDGTPFQRRVWQELAKIPYGTTISYGELARRIGNPAASRAVGMANAKNPIPIIIPCHRVIGADGTLTGFGGGLDVKQKLLALEGWNPVRSRRKRK